MELGTTGNRDLTSPMLRVPEILARMSVSRSCFYKQIDLELAPPNICLSERARGQHEHVVDALIGTRIALRSEMTRLRDPVTFPKWTPEMEFGEYPTGMRLLKLSAVEKKVGLKKSQLYRLIEGGQFPAPVPLTQCARRWLVHEIDEWLKGRVAFSLKISGQRKIRR